MSASVLVPFALLALLGSAHCAGMCGGLALLASGGSLSGRRRALAVVLFVIGKCTTYSVLGAAVALATHSAAHASGVPEDFETTRELIALAAGALLLLAGVAQLLRPRITGGGLTRGVSRLLGGATRALGSLPPNWRAFGLGLVSGLLPCGLTLGALALAAQATPAEAVLGMFAFGLGTSPALAAVASAASWAPPGLRQLGARLVGPALIALGLLVVVRGARPLANPDASCCEPAGAVQRVP